ncbi:SPOR domain-containing protein [Arundinibacter roseus]|uniref:SPOR domain-containing protein n=1 Tax=Arundinibacter roseus TaxID=2070510 RepID=A0A4R4KPQ8_9BACT|nr:SPOR domain-containing protein [Arundinibacter roseus]TDB68906.1 SPOR domain-containing protein [Arundinibacter roseus]
MNFYKVFRYSLALSIFLGLSACARKTTPGSAAESFEKNLASVRPHYSYVEPVPEKKQQPEKKEPVRYRPSPDDKPLYINRQLEAVLDTMAQQNKAIRYISGFRIQLYVGNIRQEADAAKAFVYQSFSELAPYVSYSQPTYRVKAGDFMYRTDADNYLAQIRQQYPAAVILPERVEIKKGLQIRASTDFPKY